MHEGRGSQMHAGECGAYALVELRMKSLLLCSEAVRQNHASCVRAFLGMIMSASKSSREDD